MKSEEMCPVLTASKTAVERECRRENCAWWVEDKQACAIKALATILGRKK